MGESNEPLQEWKFDLLSGIVIQPEEFDCPHTH